MTSKAEYDTLLRTFQRFDDDNSSSIDTSELRNVMEHLGVHMGESQLWALVEQIDKNKNGELEFDEFRQLMNMWKEASRFRLFDGEGVKSLVEVKVSNALSTKLFMTDSWGRCIFDGVIAFVTFALFIIITFDDVSNFSHTTTLWSCVFAEIVFFADFIVSMFTINITDENQVEDDVKRCAVAYSKSWMVPDMIAFIPWEVIFYSLPTVSLVTRHLHLIKLFKLRRFWRASGRMPMSATYIHFHFKTLPITLLLAQFMILLHFFAVAMIFIKTNYSDDPLVEAHSGGYYSYPVALYFVVYCFGTVGFGDVDLSGTLEKWFACTVLLGTLAANAFITGKLISIMQKANIESERVNKLRETLAILQHFHIPSQLQDEVLQFQDHMLGHSLSTSYASVVEGLPLEMQSNISLFVKLRLLCSAPQLKSSHYIVQVAIAEALVNHVALPEQSIVAANEETTTMYFIAHGFADVYAPDGGHLTTLQTGDYFGDSMPYLGAPSLVSVKALTYCDLWGLHRSDFLPLLERFPRFKRSVEETGQERGLCVVSPDSDDGEDAEVVAGGGDAPGVATAEEGSGAPEKQDRSFSESAADTTPPSSSNPSGRIVSADSGASMGAHSNTAASLAALQIQNAEKLQFIMERLKICSSQIQTLY